MRKFLCVLVSAMLLVCFASGGAVAEDKVHLEYFNVKPEVADIYNTLIEKFEAENPNIEIEQTQVPDATTVLQTRLSTNNMPDIISHWATDPVFKAMVSYGVLMDLTDNDVLSTVKPDMLEGIKIDGKVYDLPISMNTAGVFYNVRIFKENNIQIPTTYEEFIAVCDQLKAAGITPLEMFNKDGHAGTIGTMLEITDVPNFEQATVDIYNGTTQVTDYPGMRTTAEKLIQLQDYAQEDAMGTGYDQALAAFANEDAAMIIEGIWIIPTVKADNPNLDFSCFAFPANKGVTTRVPYQNDHCLAISESCQHKEEALKFLKFMADPENAQYYADMDGSPSYIEGVETKLAEPQPLVEYFNNAALTAIWPDQLWQAGTLDNYSNYCQALITDHDIDAFLANLQSIFVEHY